MALAVGYRYDLPFVQLPIRLPKLSVGRAEQLTWPMAIFFICQMRVRQLHLKAILRQAGFLIFFRSLLLLNFIDGVLFGGDLFDIVINFCIGADGEVGETACYTSQSFAFGIEVKPFVVLRRSALFLGLEPELFIIRQANLIVKIALPAPALAVYCLHRAGWQLRPALEPPRSTQHLHLHFLHRFCCHYYYSI